MCSMEGFEFVIDNRPDDGDGAEEIVNISDDSYEESQDDQDDSEDCSSYYSSDGYESDDSESDEDGYESGDSESDEDFVRAGAIGVVVVVEFDMCWWG